MIGWTAFLTEANRHATRLRRRHRGWRARLSPGAIEALNRLQLSFTASLSRVVPVRRRCGYVNLYHCCVQKSGSQWIRSILSDWSTYQYSGLLSYSYQSRIPGGRDTRAIRGRAFTEPFPARTIVSPLYIGYDRFREIPRRGPWRAFFVLRDPRDILVSWYFSSLYSHLPGEKVIFHRRRLEGLSRADGIAYGIETMAETGIFDAIRSWAKAAGSDESVRLVRYEDLRTNRTEIFRSLFDFLDIRMPDDRLKALIAAYSFKRLTGRSAGREDVRSHLRKGSAGDWKNHLDDGLASRFEEAAGNLIEMLGYSWR